MTFSGQTETAKQTYMILNLLILKVSERTVVACRDVV